ncbi:unnamed protein product [Rhizophagus irregularis]|nr:unnamed protein product [Rhizophagus irregularis]
MITYHIFTPHNGDNEDSDDFSKGFLCYRERSKSNEVEIFKGITYWIGLKNETSELSRDWFFIKVDKNETLEEAHKRYKNKSITISFEINGRIDMRKSGSTYAATSLRFTKG